MQLHVIGNWAGSPGPGSACSGYLVSEGDTKVLLDCGPGVMPSLQEGHDPGSVSAIFISHMHRDHSLDLLTYAYRLLRFAWRGLAEEDRRRIPLYLLAAYGRPEGSRLSDPFAAAFEVHEIGEDCTVRVNGLAVSAYLVHHAVPALGYRVASGQDVLAYTGDSAPCEGLYALAEGASLLLSEAMTAEADPARANGVGHLTAQQAGTIAAVAGARRLMLTHFTRQDAEWLSSLREAAEGTFGRSVMLSGKGQKTVVGAGEGAGVFHKDKDA